MAIAGSAAGKGVALGASALAHVAVALAAWGTGGGGAGPAHAAAARDEQVLAMVDLESEDAPPALPDAPADSDHAAHHDFAHHTHPYPVPPDHDAHPHDPRLEHVPSAPPGIAGPAAALGNPYDDAPAAGPPAIAATSAPLHFSLPSVGNGQPSGAPGGAQGDGAERAGSPPAATTVYAAGQVSVAARPISTTRPAYPPGARASGVEADVALEIVVDVTGAVISARAVRRAGRGFDEAAEQAARTFRFTPAMREGRPVRVRMPWLVSFRLQ